MALGKIRWLVNAVHSGSVKCEEFLDLLRRSKVMTKHFASCAQLDIQNFLKTNKKSFLYLFKLRTKMA